MKKITKAVIPCGGFGTRFLPITKAVPKEILPIIDTPVLGHIIKEAADSGITDVLIVLGKGKESIRNYFSPKPDLEDALEKSGKTKLLELVKSTDCGVRITYAEQKFPLGSGDAVLYAEEFANGEPFCLAWGDDLMYAQTPVMKQLIDAFNKVQTSVLGVQYYAGDDIVKYGVASVSPHSDRLYKCSAIVEKPALKDIPSRLACLGRYVVTPDVFDVIRATPTGLNGELQLTDSLNAMCRGGKMHAYDFEGKRYDMGDKFGSLQAIVEYALRNPEFGKDVKSYLIDLVKTLV